MTLDGGMIVPHPEFFQEVDIVLLPTDQGANLLHSGLHNTILGSSEYNIWAYTLQYSGQYNIRAYTIQYSGLHSTILGSSEYNIRAYTIQYSDLC